MNVVASWGPLRERLAEVGRDLSEDELIALPFRVEFSARPAVQLDDG